MRPLEPYNGTTAAWTYLCDCTLASFVMPRRAGIILCLVWGEMASESSWACKTWLKSSPLKSPVIKQHMAWATRGVDGKDVCGWRKATIDWVIMSMVSLLWISTKCTSDKARLQRKRESDLVAGAIIEFEGVSWSREQLTMWQFSRSENIKYGQLTSLLLPYLIAGRRIPYFSAKSDHIGTSESTGDSGPHLMSWNQFRACYIIMDTQELSADLRLYQANNGGVILPDIIYNSF